MRIRPLNAVITDATKARKYIEDFSKAFGQYITYVDTPTRRIEFATMTDEDAVFVANEFKRMTGESAKMINN